MNSNDKLQIAEAAADDVEAVRLLWREYWESLGFSPDFQNFTNELASLPGKYAPPQGRLLLARVAGEIAGTAALRPTGENACEMKRLYVRPAFRKLGLGKALLDRLLSEARAAGYRDLYADTMPSMKAALRMYKLAQFVETVAYSPEPTPCAVFLKLVL